MYAETCEIHIDHKSLKYIFQQKDLNLGQRRWIGLLRDFDCAILYHLGMENVLANALGRKSMGSLALIVEIRRPIVKEFQELVDKGVKFEVTSAETLLAHVQVRSTLVDIVKTS